MKLPFQCVLARDDILFAARGGNLHSFKIEDGSYISSWRHPVTNQANGKSKSDYTGGEGVANAVASSQVSPEQDQGPPAKRVRLDDTPEPAQQQTQEDGKHGEAKGSEKKANRRAHAASGPSERPFIQVLTATNNGQYIVAVSGQDKTIWVFEHDLAGNLKQLSQRQMPKRPCSVVITPDNKTLLSADKFGDVYSLPLIPSDKPRSDTPARESSTPTPSRTFAPSANPLTVHTGRNLRALEMQKQQIEKQKIIPKSEAASFEHNLLLGHVSLLTDIALGSLDGKQYVLTADRDEHIRVSRGIPQTHIIEAYCLGHDEFINKLCVPVDQPSLLVSGGGDQDLYAWNWRQGKLLSKAPLLEHAKKVKGCEESENVAVSGLCSASSFGADAQVTSIFAICERVPAIFCFRLTGDGSIQYESTIETQGNPLSLEVLKSPTKNNRLVVAVDQPEASLLVVELGKDSQANAGHFEEDAAENEDIGLSVDDLGKILYTAENLRKVDFEDGADTEA